MISSRIGVGTALLAGVVGGLVATVAKSACEAISPPRLPGVPSPLERALDAVSLGVRGTPAPAARRLEPVAHYLFGALAGATYAGIRQRFPGYARATARRSASRSGWAHTRPPCRGWACRPRRPR